nr:hypothetical protein [Tanacetum cinerariifolium]
MMATSKVPMLKPGEFKIQRMRIKQYIKMMDYALWEVIENDATLLQNHVVEGVTKEIPITTVEEKAQRRLEVKARITLMMGIPNEHQLKFNSIKDAKQLLEAVKKIFGRNAAIKKTQRNLLIQQFENFLALSSEMLNQTFDRLQNLVSQLELLGEKLSQVDVNQKLLRSLSPEWNTHVVVWRNKADLDTMSMDDLYNNLKIVDNCKKGLGYMNYNAVPPPYTGNFMPPKPDLYFTGLNEFVNKPVVENYKAKSSEKEPKVVRKNNDAPIIKEWVSDNKEEEMTHPKIMKKTVKPSIPKIEFVKPRQQEKTARKTVKQVEHNRQNTHRPRGNKRN